MSRSGPVGPIFSGVWQSLQPVALTRYSPRLARAVVAAGPPDSVEQLPCSVQPTAVINVDSRMARRASRVVRVLMRHAPLTWLLLVIRPLRRTVTARPRRPP